MAYEHLLANTKIYKLGKGTVRFSELRHPLKELDKIPNGKGGEDWGIHDDELLEKACRDSGIPLRKGNVSVTEALNP